jgi:hypothetical protein
MEADMARAYSQDLRNRVINAALAGLPAHRMDTGKRRPSSPAFAAQA